MKLLVTAAALCVATFAAHADIKVGVVLSLTGPGASLGIPAKNTVAMWPKEIAGQKLVVTVLDDASDPTAATVAARRLTQEEHVDVLVGSSITPTSLAVMQVAGETQTPAITLAGSDAIVLPQEGPKRWAFKMPPSEPVPLKMIFDHMTAQKQKKLAIAAVANAYGQTFIDVAQKMAGAAGIEIVSVERYAATDTSFVAQTVKLLVTAPDAVLIAAAGTPGALPHLELKKRGFSGTIFQTQAVANNDFLRIGGKDVDGALLPVSPLLVAEQLPDANPVKAVALVYVNKFEAQYGAGSRSLFGAMAWDAMAIVEKSAPAALQKAKPGTAEFRKALRDAIETSRDLVLTQGVYTMSPTDHNGADKRSQVMVRIDNGKWRYAE